MGYEESQPFCVVGGIAGDGKPVCGGRRIADEHLVEVAFLVGPRKLRNVAWIDSCSYLVCRVDAAAK